MPKDRDQMTPTEPEDRARLAGHRGQGTAGTGHDVLPSERPGERSGEPGESDEPAAGTGGRADEG